MKFITECPLCQSENVTYTTAYLASFIHSIIKGKKLTTKVPINSISCNNCKFYCSSLRFEENEMEKIYSAYRQYEYNKLRVDIEGQWYQNHIGKFTSEETIEVRLKLVSNLINQFINVEDIKTVLDYGGGSGYFIPKEFQHKDNYVFDVSNVSLCPGIKRYTKDRQIVLDYIQCCHVLEHIPDPIEFLKNMLTLANTETLIYIEVPDGDGPVVGGQWHEHINTFNNSCLEYLLKKVNLHILGMMNLNGSIGVLTKKARE